LSLDRALLWRVAAVQAAAVAALSIVLALALSRHFFVDWGFLAGPLAWLACALLTARVLHLRTASTMAGAVVAGIPSVAAVLIGVHWLGAVLAVGVFALWCATRPAR
jgi:hypothetical protein